MTNAKKWLVTHGDKIGCNETHEVRENVITRCCDQPWLLLSERAAEERRTVGY